MIMSIAITASGITAYGTGVGFVAKRFGAQVAEARARRRVACRAGRETRAGARAVTVCRIATHQVTIESPASSTENEKRPSPSRPTCPRRGTAADRGRPTSRRSP